jgi:hypothetical protein
MGVLSDFFDVKYFLISFFIGIFLVYISTPEPEVIIKYPTPINSGETVYEDNAEMCYVYDADELTCPSTGVLETPVQQVNNKDKNEGTFWSKIIPSLN